MNEISTTVSILINIVQYFDVTGLENLLKTLQSTVPMLIAIPAMRNSTLSQSLPENLSNVHFYQIANDSDGVANIWKVLTEAATTKYIFVGRGLRNFTNLNKDFGKLLDVIRWVSYLTFYILNPNLRFRGHICNFRYVKEIRRFGCWRIS